MLDTTQIKEGMTVYTDTNDKLGTVDYVQFGDEDPNHHGVETATASQAGKSAPTLIEAVGQALTGGNDHLPEEVRANLIRYGYFRLKTGNLFESDYYVPFNLVTDVVGGNIHIQTTKENLITT